MGGIRASNFKSLFVKLQETYHFNKFWKGVQKRIIDRDRIIEDLGYVAFFTINSEIDSDYEYSSLKFICSKKEISKFYVKINF